MTETCSHPKGTLVVPEKVIPAFQNSLLPRISPTVVEPKKTISRSLKAVFNKSTAISGPALAIGSMTGFVSFAQVDPNPDLFTLMGVTLAFMTGMVGGSFGAVNSFISLINGDREFFPLPATKEYLQRELSKQDALITPFSEWDKVFAKNDDRMQKMLTPGN